MSWIGKMEHGLHRLKGFSPIKSVLIQLILLSVFYLLQAIETRTLPGRQTGDFAGKSVRRKGRKS